MSEEKAEITIEENLILSENHNDISNNKEIKIEEASIDELIDIIKGYIHHNNPTSISKKAELVKALFYKQLNKSSDQTEKEKTDPKEIIFKQFFNDYRKHRNLFRKEAEKKESKNLEIKKEIIEEIKDLTSEVELEKNTFKKFRLLQDKWNDTGHVSLREKNEIWQTYNHYVEVFYDYLRLNRDLRDIDFKKNLDVKIKICIEAERLISLKSLNEMHAKLQDLHEEWKNTGPVNKENRDKIWSRFQEASRKINKKRNDYFLEIKKNDILKIESKREIILEIDNLSKEEFKSHKDCLNAIEKCNVLSEKWKSLGRVNKKDNKTCWKEFQLSLNNFYKNKNKFYKNRKKNTKKLIEEKIKLCEEVEKIKNNTDWNISSKKIIKLQDQWKNTEFIKGKLNNDLWLRFKISCDTFFNAKKIYLKEINNEKKKKLKDKTNLLSLVANYKKTKDPLENIKFIKDNCKKWKDYESSENSLKIDKEFKSACENILNGLDLEKKQIEKEKYLVHVSFLANNTKELIKQKTILKEKINSKKKEINQFENNKSYIVVTKKKNPLLDQIERKINILAENIDALQNNLKILNNI